MKKTSYQPGDLVFLGEHPLVHSELWNQHLIIKKILSESDFGILYDCYFLNAPYWLKDHNNSMVIHESNLPDLQK